MRAVGKHNCINTLKMNADRVEDFKERVAIRGLANADVVIVVMNVNDHNGAMLADALMPGHDWQAIRDRGETPFARGLARRLARSASDSAPMAPSRVSPCTAAGATS